MLRFSNLAFIAVGLLVTEASASSDVFLDEFDDIRILHAVDDAQEVKESRQELQELGKRLLKLDRVALSSLLGKPAEKSAKTYAMPVGETRNICIPGIRKAGDNRPDEDFVSFHSVGDFAAVEAYYSRFNQDGDTPFAVRIYLKVNKAFPKLTKDNLDQRLAWDQGQFRKLVEHIGKMADRLGQAAEGPKVIAEGEWSKPVDDNRGYAVRGRLVLCEKFAGDDLREVAVYVELQDASKAIGQGMQLFCEMGKSDLGPEYKGGLQCEMHDKDKRLVNHTDYSFGGATPRSEWVRLPGDATMRLRASPFGVRRAKAMSITPHLGKLWVIEDGDPNEYFLSGTFTVAPADDGIEKNGVHIWRGAIVLPTVRIKNNAADEPRFPELPESSVKLIETLKASGDRYTINRPRLNYVRETDLPYLVGLLDSKEPCAFVDLSISSIRYPGKSTVGHEAAYLIDGFWKRSYPTGLTSQQYKPNIEEIKLWYGTWSHLKKLAEPDGAANGSQPIRKE